MRSVLIQNSCACVLAIIALAAGCQHSERVNVDGRVVRHDGTPLKHATVIARSDETGKWARGTTDSDGYYELGTASAGDGIPPGVYRVTIMEGEDDLRRSPPTVPAKYVNPTSSKLELTVAKGKRITFDIKLDPS
jgi:hypothetical protein